MIVPMLFHSTEVSEKKMKISHHYRNAKSRWRQYLADHYFIYGLGFFFVVGTDFFQVLVTRSLGWILDFFSGKEIPQFFIVSGHRHETFFRLLFFVIIIRFFVLFFRFGWRMTIARQTHRASSELKSFLWENVRYFKEDDLLKRFTKGTLINISTSDIGTGRFVYGFTLIGVIDMIFLGLFTLITMFLIHPLLTFYSFLVLLILPFFIRKLSFIEMESYRNAQEKLGSFNELTTQVISTIRLQRVNQSGDFWTKRLHLMAEEYRKKRLGAVFTSLLYIPLMGGASFFSHLILFFIGISYVLGGELSVGDFVAMQGLAFLLQDPLLELGLMVSEWKKSFTSLSRLDEVFENEKDFHFSSFSLEESSYEKKGEISSLYSIQNLNFKFPGSEKNLIQDFSFHLRKGERLGIIGPIGSGKSTLIHILSGLERRFTGEVLFHGYKFSHYSHDFLRKSIGYVQQNPFLFADTIRSNMSLDQDMSDEEIWHYLDLASLADDILKLENKLDTPLGEWGINLSGGQKQRLTLARALGRKCSVYFFDDALSAVDTVTEERILSRLNCELREETLIWVAHRRSTLKYCGVILELPSFRKERHQNWER